jgi:GMP synthase-like glutamine amidotransferase
MKPVAIFQHDGLNFPAYFGEFLRARGHPVHHVRLDLGEPVPTDVTEFAGLGFMGGVMSVNDEHVHPFLTEEFRLIRDAHCAGIPVIGHCLGGQLISKALGGRVGRNRVPEIGWHPVRKLPGAATEQWLGDLPDTCIALQWHTETFSVPAGAEPMLTSEHCENQAFVIGNCLALQAHVEVTADVIDKWIEQSGADLTPKADHVQGAEALREGARIHAGSLRRLADRLYGRWVSLLKR